jgi:hypothetical protein
MLPVYEDHIKPTCASLGLTVRRADDFFTAHSVIQDIWKAKRNVLRCATPLNAFAELDTHNFFPNSLAL